MVEGQGDDADDVGPIEATPSECNLWEGSVGRCGVVLGGVGSLCGACGSSGGLLRGILEAAVRQV